MSPPPLINPSQLRQLQDVPQYVEERVPNTQGRYTYDGGDGAYVQAPALPEPRPITPSARRIMSRNGQRRIVNDDTDLRRVVSMKNMQAPPSPNFRDVQYAEAQPRIFRAASQIQYVSSAERAPPPQYRASVQPQMRPQSSSTQFRQVALSPPPTMAMQPPSRRIVVDQFGNRYMEAPAQPERSMSMAPMTQRQVAPEPQYEPLQSSHTYHQPQQIVS